MAEMGSIINKVTANGRAMTENLNQLQDRGIPILQWLAEEYGVWKEKSMYGRTYMGIERTTFIIDARGRIERIFSRVRVPGHVDEVLGALAD